MSAGTTKPATTWRPPPQGEWTYADFLRLPDNGYRYELIRGSLYMSPAPSARHQRVIIALTLAIETFLRRSKIGLLFIAPFDVRLEENTLVQPDLMVVLNDRSGIVTHRGVEGAPDLMVEVLSPSNNAVDRRVKFELYLKHQVREYWMVDPDKQAIEVYVLRGDVYALFAKFERGQMAESEVLPGLAVNTSDVFPRE